MPLEPGTTLGPYEIIGPIGAGGMGEVYKATEAVLHPVSRSSTSFTVLDSQRGPYK